MKETRICANCGTEHSIEDMYQVEGDWLCEDCADRLTVICDHCAERFYEENIVEDDTHTLCDHRFDEYYVRCDDCGRIIHRDRAYWDGDDNAYCASCWDEHCEVIHEYSYTPDLVFHGKGLRHFGVELEIDDGGTVNSNAQKLLDIANKDAENLYIKTDGSLDEGLELVTHPMTLEYQLNEMPWAEVLRKAQSMGYLSHAGRDLWTSCSHLSPCIRLHLRAAGSCDCAVAVFRREILGGAAAVQPPHAVPDEPLGGAVWHPAHSIRADESCEEFLRRTIYCGQPHERGYGRNPHVPRNFEAEYPQSHLADGQPSRRGGCCFVRHCGAGDELVRLSR